MEKKLRLTFLLYKQKLHFTFLQRIAETPMETRLHHQPTTGKAGEHSEATEYSQCSPSRETTNSQNLWERGAPGCSSLVPKRSHKSSRFRKREAASGWYEGAPQHRKALAPIHSTANPQTQRIPPLPECSTNNPFQMNTF